MFSATKFQTSTIFQLLMLGALAAKTRRGEDSLSGDVEADDGSET